MSILVPISSSKRLRKCIQTDQTLQIPKISNSSWDTFYNDTYITLFCKYMRLKEVLLIITKLSKYHHKILYKSSNKHLLKTLITYDFHKILFSYPSIILQFKKCDKSYKPKNIINNLYNNLDYINKITNEYKEIRQE